MAYTARLASDGSVVEQRTANAPLVFTADEGARLEAGAWVLWELAA